jgi:hypothetical protein
MHFGGWYVDDDWSGTGDHRRRNMSLGILLCAIGTIPALDGFASAETLTFETHIEN